MANYSNSKKITIWQLRKWGYFSDKPQGIITWDKDSWSRHDNLVQGTIAIQAELEKRLLNVGYVVEKEDDTRQRFNFPVYLERQKCYFGGFRLFMICPLIEDGVPCKRRTTVLYKPDESYFLGCRVCHSIRYPGQLISNKYRRNKDFLAMLYDTKIIDLEDEIKRKRYAGKLTKKQVQLNKLYQKVGLSELIHS